MRTIPYNSQRDNFSFAGKFPGWAQCMSTCAWMFLSWYRPEVDATDDAGLAAYVDDVEASVGKPGIGEKIREKYNWITGRTSTWWLVQQAALQQRLPGKRIMFHDRFPIEQLIDIVRIGPVIIGTNKMGGLPGGHIILLCDYDAINYSYLVNDPYGNALTGYKDPTGQGVPYPFPWLIPFIDYGKNQCRVIYTI